MDRPWGKWTRLYLDEQVELRRLEVLKGGYCTKHYHEYQANVFLVLSGQLTVYRWGIDALVEVVTPGCQTTVGPYETHQFKAESGDVVAYEFNYATGPIPVDARDSVHLGEAGRD